MDLQQRIQFHQQAQQTKLQEIMQLYGLKPEDCVLPEKLSNEIHALHDQMLVDEKWQKRRDDWVPTATLEHRAALNNAARDILHTYAQTFYAYYRSMNALKASAEKLIHSSEPIPVHTEFFHLHHHFSTLFKIYANHATNEAQLKLLELTDGNAEAAFSLHTYLAGKVINWGRKDYLHEGAYIHPEVSREKTILENIEHIETFWQERTEFLDKQLREAMQKQSSHVAALSARKSSDNERYR